MRTSRLAPIALAALFTPLAFSVESKSDVAEGTITKIDHAAKTAVVKTKDGAEHTFHFVGRTTVHGAEATAAGAKDAFHGVKEGSEVVVHYTAKAGKETADEVDHIGKDGLKVGEGTVSHIDRGAKTLTVKAADGTEATYHMAAHATKDAGKGIGEGAEKTAKVTVYYTEEGGKKVAHFFKKAAD
jgi:hypothetical protein